MQERSYPQRMRDGRIVQVPESQLDAAVSAAVQSVHRGTGEPIMSAGVHLTLADLAAEVALDLDVRVNPVAQGDDLVVGQVLGAQVRADARGLEGLRGLRATDAVDVGEGDDEPLFAGNVNAGDACHGDLSQPCRCLWRGFSQMT